MINIVVIDDEALMRSLITTLLKEQKKSIECQFNCKAYSSAEDFLSDPESIETDILILDIELPGISGMELARSIKHSHKKTKIIFLTSYEHYMKDAFGLNVHSYTLKKYINEELIDHINELINYNKNREQNILEFNTYFGKVNLAEEDIRCILYENRHPVIYLRNMKLTVFGTSLTSVYELLNKQLFIQPNNGAIINAKCIESLDKSSMKVLDVSVNIIISRAKYKDIRELYIQHLMEGSSL